LIGKAFTLAAKKGKQTLREVLNDESELFFLLIKDYALKIIQAVANFQNSEIGKGHFLVHRYICPENILIGPGGQVQLADFRSKLVIPVRETNHNHPRATISHLYEAPEQLLGKPYNGKVDSYAIFLILFEMATFRTYHTATDYSALCLEYRKHDGKLTLGSDLDPDLASLLRELGAFNPVERLTPSEALNHHYFK